MSVLTKFLPKTLIKINSSINGEISVIEQLGKRKIVVGGLTQSGPMVQEVWDEAIKQLNTKYIIPNTILILGLGGGSLVKLLNKKFDNAKIIGVEIDPLMIDLGKKYLELEKAKNLKIVISDANRYISQYSSNKRREREVSDGSSRTLFSNNNLFDLILVDLYQGDKVPKFLENKLFLKNIKKILTKNGIVVFNRLCYKNHIFEAEIFLDKLRKIFNDLICKNVLTNLIIFCRN